MSQGNSTDRMGVHDLLDQAAALIRSLNKPGEPTSLVTSDQADAWIDSYEEYQEDRPKEGEEVVETIEQWQDMVHDTAVEKGWWDGWSEMDNTAQLNLVGTKLALVHSEVSEALEEVRRGRLAMWGHGDGGKPEGFVVELADGVIRMMDLCGRMKLDLAHAMRIKHRYNTGREHRHGGKLL